MASPFLAALAGASEQSTQDRRARTDQEDLLARLTEASNLKEGAERRRDDRKRNQDNLFKGYQALAVEGKKARIAAGFEEGIKKDLPKGEQVLLQGLAAASDQEKRDLRKGARQERHQGFLEDLSAANQSLVEVGEPKIDLPDKGGGKRRKAVREGQERADIKKAGETRTGDLTDRLRDKAAEARLVSGEGRDVAEEGRDVVEEGRKDERLGLERFRALNPRPAIEIRLPPASELASVERDIKDLDSKMGSQLSLEGLTQRQVLLSLPNGEELLAEMEVERKALQERK